MSDETRFVIWNKETNLFWSNADGWGDVDSATQFTRREINTFRHIPQGGSPLELIKKFYQIIGTSAGSPGNPLTYRGHIYVIPGIGNCYLALDKQFGDGDLAGWLEDDTFHEELKTYSEDGIAFANDDTTYEVRIADESFDGEPRAYSLRVDHEILPKQIDMLSKLLGNIVDDEKYEIAVGGVRLLEEIQKQKPD